MAKKEEFRVYNSMTQQKEVFKPRVPGKAGMYVCGVTAYDLSHIGHARAAVNFDVLYRLMFIHYIYIYTCMFVHFGFCIVKSFLKIIFLFDQIEFFPINFNEFR